MRILKRGSVPEERIMTATCTTCQSVLEATAGELTKQVEPRDIFWQGICPVCNRVCFFYPSEDNRC